MTLSTDLVIADPIEPRKVFDYALSLLKRGVTFEPTWHYDEPGKWHADEGSFVTTCGQGLPAWLFVHHAVDGPMRRYSDEEIVEWQEDDPTWQPPDLNEHCVRVNVDTAYSWHGPGGRGGCSDLHAWFVSEMWAWLTDHGISRMMWSNEYTGEWFTDIASILELGNPVLGALAEAA